MIVKKKIWFSQVLLLHDFNGRANDEVSGKFVFVSEFLILLANDSFDRVVNCL